jgi:hypothetical protein
MWPSNQVILLRLLVLLLLGQVPRQLVVALHYR